MENFQGELICEYDYYKFILMAHLYAKMQKEKGDNTGMYSYRTDRITRLSISFYATNVTTKQALLYLEKQRGCYTEAHEAM